MESPWLRCAQDNLRGQKSLGPLKMSHEMAKKVIVPQKKNYVPQFLKQRDINSYYIRKKNERFAHSLFFGEICERIAQVTQRK